MKLVKFNESFVSKIFLYIKKKEKLKFCIEIWCCPMNPIKINKKCKLEKQFDGGNVFSKLGNNIFRLLIYVYMSNLNTTNSILSLTLIMAIHCVLY